VEEMVAPWTNPEVDSAPTVMVSVVTAPRVVTDWRVSDEATVMLLKRPPSPSNIVADTEPSTMAFPVMDASPTTVKLSVSVSTIKLVAETVPANTVPVVVKPVVVMVPVAGSDLRSLFEVRLKFPSLNWMTPFFPEADALPPPSKELSMELILLIKDIKTYSINNDGSV
jgi:hypothetical protein